MARGPQVMLGYYKKPELTEAMIDNEGWLNTGDLGMLTVDNELKIVGRAKDTIVLLGGENVEPLPIEDALKESPYIERAVVLGQDQKFLAALLVPDFDALEGFADENSVPYDERSSLVEAPEVQELINSEISELVGPKRGFKSFERVYRFKLLDHDFDLGEELSAKQEVKRHIVAEKYEDDIRKLFG
jgi:long-chain acyl-CoA synthetase